MDIFINIPTNLPGQQYYEPAARCIKLSLRSIDTFRIHRARAGKMHLHVALVLGVGVWGKRRHISAATHTMLEEIASTSPQWASLCLVSHGAIPKVIIETVSRSKSPVMTRVSVHSSFDIPFTEAIDLSSLANIRHLDSNMEVLNQGLSTITTLTLCAVRTNGLLDSLQRLDQLHTLRIAFLHYERWRLNKPPNGMVVLPSVKHIVWGRNNEDRWLDRVIVPNLSTFELHHLERIDDVYPSGSRIIKELDRGSDGPSPSWALGRMLNSGRLGSPSELVIRDLQRPRDIEILMQAFNDTIHTFAILDDQEYKPAHTIPFQRTGTPFAVFPKLQRLSVVDVADESAVADVVAMWRSREKLGLATEVCHEDGRDIIGPLLLVRDTATKLGVRSWE